MMTQNTAESIIPSMHEQVAAPDEKIIMEVVGVTQALDELRKAVVEADACLGSRDFEKAAALG
jgi:benzoyl-CoA reductase/2-hydroxyglutaryl-CoA dehydratase subunit BcrC/BadD/HgdB